MKRDEFALHIRAGASGVAQDAVGLGLDQIILVGRAHDCGLDHGRMRREGRFDFERRDPDAANLEHVVAAAAEEEEAVGVAVHGVAGAEPAVLRPRCRGSFRLVPVVPRYALALHDQFPGLTVREFVPVRVDDAQTIARRPRGRRNPAWSAPERFCA